MLKTTVKPLLEAINSPEAAGEFQVLVAQMLDFLDSFEEAPASAVPQTSVLMEFIGTSVFEE